MKNEGPLDVEPEEMPEHQHHFKQYRDGRPPHCTCGAWIRTKKEVVENEPIPDLFDRDRSSRNID